MSVKSHLTELIHKLLLAKDPDALATLESLSLEVKAAHFDAAAGAMPAGAKKVRAPAAAASAGPRGAELPARAESEARGGAPPPCSASVSAACGSASHGRARLPPLLPSRPRSRRRRCRPA